MDCQITVEQLLQRYSAGKREFAGINLNGAYLNFLRLNKFIQSWNHR
ncbi:hypothetical protein NIES267_28990 [Calothrix parasitica NIES-267]|uniref:Uncharacterized protein n=1 Tax=Calothrix parasitica NIES-267 TaxID=1973488 RepID=A0A1Z4LQ92_9CYAN|nr:hypothetical protein NIES267_28990 [Calothrix parasitica NIES-267]